MASCSAAGVPHLPDKSATNTTPHGRYASAASVSRWRKLEREQGDPRPGRLGGDRRSDRIEAHHQAVMAALGPDRDATIEEVRASLAEQGLIFGFGTIQRFFARHAITRKKRPRTPPNRTAPTS
jgi:transposase